jgi:hypothetical protein
VLVVGNFFYQRGVLVVLLQRLYME